MTDGEAYAFEKSPNILVALVFSFLIFLIVSYVSFSLVRTFPSELIIAIFAVGILHTAAGLFGLRLNIGSLIGAVFGSYLGYLLVFNYFELRYGIFHMLEVPITMIIAKVLMTYFSKRGELETFKEIGRFLIFAGIVGCSAFLSLILIVIIADIVNQINFLSYIVEYLTYSTVVGVIASLFSFGIITIFKTPDITLLVATYISGALSKEPTRRVSEGAKLVTPSASEKAVPETVIKADTGKALQETAPSVSYEKVTVTIPNYKIVRFIGSGGFASVFEAKDNQGRTVALKVFNQATEEIRKTFVKEISIWSVLQHQNIVRLLDYGIDPVPYIVMERMEGSLRDLLNKKSFQIKEALEIVLQIALALNYAHSEFNLVHRDIKPENILFKGDIFKLSDWGLSKIFKHSATSKGYIGTIAYSAPEQFDASFGGIGPWTDIWQLGVVLYELITRKLPFGEDVAKAVKNILYESPVYDNSIPEDVWRLILSMLQKDINKRPSASEIVKHLHSLLAQY